MTKELALKACRDFNVAEASLSLWAFKKRTTSGFTARSINLTDELTLQLKEIVKNALEERTEVEDYSLLAQPNEVGTLHVGSDETIYNELRGLVDQPVEENLIDSPRQLQNCAGYVIRLRHGEKILHCVKRAPDTWKTKKALSVVNVVLRANQLELVEDRSLTISKSLDFVVLDNDVIVISKKNFEVLLGYKIEYTNSFAALQQDLVFTAQFTTMQPLVDHVGTNTMHLRRMAVVHQKAHYADPDYMARLRAVAVRENWNIQFDAAGCIVPTEDSMKTILNVLLDHRLHSFLSLTTFDVQNTSAVTP